MNICFLADARAEHTRRWTKYFALKGHRVDLITWNPITLDNYEPVRLHVVRKPNPSSNVLSRMCNLPRLLAETRKIIRKIRADILHAHSAGAYGWIAMLTGFHPYVVTPWGTDILVDTKKSLWNRMITSMSLRRADLITCDAKHIKDKMVHFGVNPDKIRMVIFGVDLRRFIPRVDDDTGLREEYGLDDSPIVISTRTLTPIHDVGTFIRAIPLIKEAVPVAKFIVASDGQEREMLQNLVKFLGVSDSVRFPGYLKEDEMARWLRVADVYVSTSVTDAGLAGSTAEAMACKLPVVVTDNADNREWVTNGACGFLVPNGASDILAEHVVRLLREEEMRLEFGRLNRRIIEERNNYVTEMDRMEVMYEELVRRVKNKGERFWMVVG